MIRKPKKTAPEMIQKPAAGRRKMSRALWILVVIGVAVRVDLVALLIFAVWMFQADAGASVMTFDDPSDFDQIFTDTWTEDTEEYQVTHEAPFDMIPEDPAGNITEFSYTYYNPWDAQKLLAVTVQYDEQNYYSELERLEQFGMDEFEGIYSVTGEAPEGYQIVAMEADAYSGFSYALVPEAEDGSVTYVVIDFCNYCLDLDIHEYFPEEYLLPGFNADLDNPYKEQMQTAYD